MIDHGEYTPWSPRDIVYSENLGLTVFCGYLFNEDGDPYLAGYDGNTWQSLSDTISADIFNLVDYESGVLVCGFGYVGTSSFTGVAYYNGVEWQYPWSFNEMVTKLVWANNQLFAIGFFSEVDGVEIHNVAKLENSSWQSVLEPNTIEDGSISDLEYYEGSLYIGGNFETANGIFDFARIENGITVAVENGLVGANTGIRDLEVFNGELYLAGIIPEFQGNVGNHIVRFDGESFSNVGASFYESPNTTSIGGNVLKMLKRNGHLYALGSFYYAGSTSMYGVARWDGTEWCGVFGSEFLQGDPPFFNPVRSLGRYSEDLILYVNYEDSDGNNSPLWKYMGDEVENCTGPLKSEEQIERLVTNLYPNPSTGLLTIESEKPAQLLTVFDSLGKLVYQENMQYQTQLQIDLSHLPKGLYLVQVEGDGVLESRKVVLE